MTKKKAVYKKSPRTYHKNEEVLKKLGENIRQYRLAKDISMETLANECDFDYSQINRMELGKVNFSISQLYKIAKALNVDPVKLLPKESPEK